MNLRSLFAATILVPLGLIAADPAVKHVDAQQAAELLKQKKATVLDVRTADEFKDGHVAGAKQVDFLASDF